MLEKIPLTNSENNSSSKEKIANTTESIPPHLKKINATLTEKKSVLFEKKGATKRVPVIREKINIKTII